ncbi:peptidase M23B [Desulforamulus reducens MI-1]|uniref:Peptidase M23B n=1 Tax=Desulforamulus reducens (strain ATCC BAA-1160 / DSM 100696 / MI-1) TaxID=349161 RepID=A4J7J7_DESRM|nr:M23 family metallopeptidase [Desulforamulus reducens]ABO51050.1 peptidase M23B [Desulforamulus reducens MI-1]
MKIRRFSFDWYKKKKRDPLNNYYSYNSNNDDWASMLYSGDNWKRKKQSSRGWKTFYRIVAALGIFAILLVIKESPHPWSQQARENLKVALTTEWNVVPVLDKAVAFGLQTVNMDWPLFHELSNPVLPATTEPVQDGVWAIPVSGRVVQEFGWSKSTEDNLERFNPGIDISAPVGSPVKVVQPGKVSRIGYDRAYGEFVLIEHQKGGYTLYAGLNDISVLEDDPVQEGQVLGTIAEQSQGDPVLHFEVRENDKLVDPLKKINMTNTVTPEDKGEQNKQELKEESTDDQSKNTSNKTNREQETDKQ